MTRASLEAALAIGGGARNKTLIIEPARILEVEFIGQIGFADRLRMKKIGFVVEPKQALRSADLFFMLLLLSVLLIL